MVIAPFTRAALNYHGVNLSEMDSKTELHALIVAFTLFLAARVGLAAMPLDEPITPVPYPVFDEIELGKIELGERLFHERRLSHDDSISCASCHNLEQSGSDGRPTAIGINGIVGSVNTPTVFNSGFNIAQFWDGRAESLEDQAAGPVHNPMEMGSNWNEVIKKLRNDTYYASRFNTLYPDFITADNIVDAIATFERTLVTVDAPFDRYLRGESGAAATKAVVGYGLFKSYGCIACHQGVNVGGNMYSRMGTVDIYFDAGKALARSDQGRYNVTGEEIDRHVFKVPSLRLAANTAPYFHDGSIDSLEEAIKTMAHYQLGRQIPDRDVELIIAFLKSLVGQPFRVQP